MNFIEKYLLIAIQLLNKINPGVLIFLLLCLNHLAITPTGNQEVYFALAKQYNNPHWIPNSWVFTAWPAPRFLFQYLVGYPLQYISFEQLNILGRTICFALFSFPLALIFKKLRFSNFFILILLQVFFNNKQHFFGDEWIFGGFEPKTLAYIFVFYGIYALFSKKYNRAALFMALASWFHILVGGWLFFFAMGYIFLETHSIKQSLKSAVLYGGIVLPFAAYLFYSLSGIPSVIHGVNVDWVYVYIRSPHHCNPFVNYITKGQFWSHPAVLVFVLFNIPFFLTCLFYFRKSIDQRIRALALMSIVTFLIVAVGTILCFVDKSGTLLKYYFFRINSISYLLSLMLLLLFIDTQLLSSKLKRFLFPLLFFLTIVKLIGDGTVTIHNMLLPTMDESTTELVEYVRTHTEPMDRFIFLGYFEGERGYKQIGSSLRIKKEKYDKIMAFMRKAERERFVMRKIIPGGGENIYEWYIRIQESQQINKDISKLFEVIQRVPIQYVVSKIPRQHGRLAQVFTNGDYYMYRIKPTP